jgi:arabinofuranosyltransferase
MAALRNIGRYWFLVLALVLYGWLAYALNFTQDDAYISYRYVANYLNGHGLVYNIGERVEGFTNFGWTTLLISIGALGGDYIWWSKLIGALFGAGIVGLTYRLGQEIFGNQGLRFTALATLLVGINQSLAYWSPAGLETAAFGFFAMLAVWLFLKRSWLLIFALTMAVWIRPEGAVVTALLIIVETVQTRRWPLFTLRCAVTAFVLSLPFVGFKIWYYGSILPNPFYAKTSFNVQQLENGIEYANQFFQHYGFYYAGLISLLLLGLTWRRLSLGLRSLLLFVTMYIAYVILIGGDVLKVHRFFIPVFGGWAVLTAASLQTAVRSLHVRTQHLILFLVGGCLMGLTYYLPKDTVDQYNANEKAFIEKMEFKALEMKKSDPRPFSVAIATIGVYGYRLLGHDIIDMVGLTDSTIARYSEPPIPGMETTWKEQKHNTKYILQRAPDYIVFSTGIKPSAPAERALLLYRQFVDCYRTVGWFYLKPGAIQGVISSAFKKMKPIEGDLVPYYPVEYVQEYKTALDAYNAGDHRSAVKHYEAAIKASPRPYNPYLLYQMGFSLQALGEADKAFPIFRNLAATEPTMFEPHMELYRLAVLRGDSAEMTIHREWLQKLVPWYWPRLKAMAEEQARHSR